MEVSASSERLLGGENTREGVRRAFVNSKHDVLKEGPRGEREMRHVFSESSAFRQTRGVNLDSMVGVSWLSRFLSRTALFPDLERLALLVELTHVPDKRLERLGEVLPGNTPRPAREERGVAHSAKQGAHRRALCSGQDLVQSTFLSLPDASQPCAQARNVLARSSAMAALISSLDVSPTWSIKYQG